MGCPGCLPTEKEKQQQLEKLTANAKKDAIRDQKIYILYSLPDGTYAYMAYDAAQAAGITPIKFISHFEPIANG